MRRSTPLLVSLALTLAACGSSSSDDSSADTAGSDTTAVASSADTAADTSSGPSTTSADKPKVKLPAELPTELVKTELRAGSGDAAASGDWVIVHYVGVLSEDGTEFDNSWDRGVPFPLQLGTGSVIQGWDEGLLDTQAGGQYQLDIPSELGYGEQGSGDVIKPGAALTFVVDVLQVAKASVAADEPTITDGLKSAGATEVTFEDVVEGTGVEAKAGDDVLVDLVAYRGDTGEKVDSTWGNGGPFQLNLSDGGALPGLIEGLDGMKLGGRRLITIPAEQAFGADGNTDLGIPAGTDLVVLIDLSAVF